MIPNAITRSRSRSAPRRLRERQRRNPVCLALRVRQPGRTSRAGAHAGHEVSARSRSTGCSRNVSTGSRHVHGGVRECRRYGGFDRNEPFASRCIDEDFNRLWTAELLDSARQSVELDRARELRPVYDAAEFLLDLHSMTDACPPLALCGRHRKGLELARALGVPAHIVIDPGHAAGKRLRDYAFFDVPADPRNALLVECGQHWERAAPGVAKQATLRFLRHFDLVDPAFVDAHLDPRPLPRQRAIEVTDAITIRTDAFRFVAPVAGLSVIRKRGTLLARDGEQDVLTPYDDCVLIMPTRRPKRGETAVRLGRYVG